MGVEVVGDLAHHPVERPDAGARAGRRPPGPVGRACARPRASGGESPCCFHTTMGTSHTSQAATQQTSSSWNHSVMRAASHSSHPASGLLTWCTGRRWCPGGPRCPRPGPSRCTVVESWGSVGAGDVEAEGLEGVGGRGHRVPDHVGDGHRLGPDRDGHGDRGAVGLRSGRRRRGGADDLAGGDRGAVLPGSRWARTRRPVRAAEALA